MNVSSHSLKIKNFNAGAIIMTPKGNSLQKHVTWHTDC